MEARPSGVGDDSADFMRSLDYFGLGIRLNDARANSESYSKPPPLSPLPSQDEIGLLPYKTNEYPNEGNPTRHIVYVRSIEVRSISDQLRTVDWSRNAQ